MDRSSGPNLVCAKSMGSLQIANKAGKSQFDRDCDKVLDGFKKKWPEGVGVHKHEYLARFSIGKWSELPTEAKQIHTLSNCIVCCDKYQTYQVVFPLKPVFQLPTAINVNTTMLQQQGVNPLGPIADISALSQRFIYDDSGYFCTMNSLACLLTL